MTPATLHEHFATFTPRVHRSFVPVAQAAIRHANLSEWDTTIHFGDRVVTVAAIIEQLRLEPFLEPVDDSWEIDTRTLCLEHSPTDYAWEGIATHCEVCGTRVWE